MKAALRVDVLVLLILLTVLLCNIGTKRAFGQGVIEVPNGGSIQAAIDAASEGTTIIVHPGRYNEQVRIYKRLTIIGSGNSTVLENHVSSKTVEIVRGTNNVTFANFLVNASLDAAFGIYVGSQNNRVENNTVANHKTGICLYDSSSNFLRGNRMINNTYNFEVWGLSLSHFLQSVDESNLVNGKKVCYWVNQTDKIAPSDVGYVAFVNSANITIRNANVTRNYSGVLLAYTNESAILNVTCVNNKEGIRLVCSDSNAIVGNTVTANDWIGISVIASSGNHFSSNQISLAQNGMYFSYSSLLQARSNGNHVSRNRIFQNSYYGSYFDDSSTNYVCDNDFVNNTVSLRFDMATQNLVTDNSISQNANCGIEIDQSPGNTFYHNNFIENGANVRVIDHIGQSSPENTWDNSYPSGGNYWSEYTGTDLRKGPGQDLTGSDAIGDVAYAVVAADSDPFPLMGPFNTFEAGTWDDVAYNVDTVSDSFVSELAFDPDPESPSIRFNAEGKTTTSVFCRVAIPRALLGVENSWSVLIDNTPLSYTLASDAGFTYIYFVFANGSNTITIEGDYAISEFPVLLTLPFLVAISCATIGLGREVPKHAQREDDPQ